MVVGVVGLVLLSSALDRIRTLISPSSSSALNWIRVVPLRKTASISRPRATSISAVQPSLVSTPTIESIDPSDVRVTVPASPTSYTKVPAAGSVGTLGDGVELLVRAGRC